MEAIIMPDVREKTEVRTNRMWRVVIQNDNTTPMDVVMIILMQVFDKGYDEAMRLMLTAHTQGKVTVAVYPKKLATARQKKAMEIARALGYSDFTVTVEENNDEG